MADPKDFLPAQQMTEKVTKMLNNTDASVVLLGRVGADLSQYGMRFSHLGFALRDNPAGAWRVIDLINRCGTNHSTIETHSIMDFFLDHLFAFDTLVVIPSPILQLRLYQVLQSSLVRQLHNPHYNKIAPVHSERTQNSNQWVLEILIAAMSKEGTINNRHDALHSILIKDYQPDFIQTSWLDRWLAYFFRKDIDFRDHSRAEWSKGWFELVTVRAVVRFLEKQNDVQTVQVLEYAKVSDKDNDVESYKAVIQSQPIKEMNL